MKQGCARRLLFVLLCTIGVLGCAPESGPPENPAPKPTGGPAADTAPVESAR
jgi:hypothetical protein